MKEGLLMAAVVLRLICEEEGQGLAEYAIIVTTVALLVVGAVAALGLAVQGLLDHFPRMSRLDAPNLGRQRALVSF